MTDRALSGGADTQSGNADISPVQPLEFTRAATWQGGCNLQGHLDFPTPTEDLEENPMNRKTPSIIGAAVGLALFLAIALLPALP